MKKIINENQFLKVFINAADKNDEVEILKVFNENIISPNNLYDMINSLSEKKYIKYVDTQHYRITYKGRSAYISPRKSFLKSIFKGGKVTIREIISFILGIISTVIANIALKWLGLD